MPVSSVPGSETGLHEDHAQFGGGFEDEFAIAFGEGGIVEGDELFGDVTSAAGETDDESAEGLGRGSGAPGAAGFAEELADGFEDLRSVLGDEADGFAVDEELVFAEDGFDGEILPGGDADELGDFEIGGAEAIEEGDEAVGVAAGDGEVCAAEGSPGWSDREVELFVVNAAEELGVGGGTASADSGKGATLAEEASKVHAGIDGDFGCVHRGSRAPKLRQICLTRKIRFVDNKGVKWHSEGKVETNLSQLAVPAT
jgi:hypothetical protein